MTTKELLAYAEGIRASHIGLDATASAYAKKGLFKWWRRGRNLMRKTKEKEGVK